MTSLPSVANRYISLRPGPNNAPEIPDGGVIETDKTTNAVDLDQLFNTLEPRTRKGLQNTLQGFATWYAGQSDNLQQDLQVPRPVARQLHAGACRSSAATRRRSPNSS